MCFDKDFWVFEILKDDTVNVITPAASARGIRVYPNPAKDYVQFEVHSSKFEVMELRLFDVFGRQVARKEITSEQTILDVSGLPGGVYFYRLASG
jgi:aminopeptidase YwaD